MHDRMTHTARLTVAGPLRSDRGVALLMVLWIMTILAVVVLYV